MAKSFFIVRAVVAGPLRDQFERWYMADHLPLALNVFRCTKAWRFWSEVEEGVHYAVYQFTDRAALDAALSTDGFKAMVADFNASWPEGVTRTRDIVTLVEERES